MNLNFKIWAYFMQDYYTMPGSELQHGQLFQDYSWVAVSELHCVIVYCEIMLIPCKYLGDSSQVYRWSTTEWAMPGFYIQC